MKKETYKIQGMHCASCVARIEHALSKTAGVHLASVNFVSESALVEFDEDLISESGLAKAVESAGYRLIPKNIKIDPPKKNETTTDKNNEIILIKVLGMDSPHCAMVVEGAIKKLAGIKNIDVDFSNQRAKVVFDSSVLNIGTIFQVIVDAGYKPIKEEGRRIA